MGSPKASVLPEPVGALPQTSSPARAGGMAAAWTGKGSVRLCWVRRTQRSSATPSAEKVVWVVDCIVVVPVRGSGRDGPDRDQPLCVLQLSTARQTAASLQQG